VNPQTLFSAFFDIGLKSLGHPAPHFDIMRKAATAGPLKVDPEVYADTLAFAQTVPGFTSCQTAWIIGQSRAGLAGGAAAVAGYVLPSAVLMLIFAVAVVLTGGTVNGWAAGVWHGAAVASVILFTAALARLWPVFAPDALTTMLALLAGMIVWILPDAPAQILVLGAAALLGAALNLKPAETISFEPAPVFDRHSWKWITGLALLVVLFLPWIAGDGVFGLLAGHIRAGVVIFGDGLVVVPALEAELVPDGFLTGHDIMAGFGIAQAAGMARPVLGLFTGTVAGPAVAPGFLAPAVGLLAGAALLLPSVAIAATFWPTWHRWQRMHGVASGLAGVKAALAGILVAAFFHPVLASGLNGLGDLFLLALGARAVFRLGCPPWLLVAGTALISAALTIT